uniref:Reverse transcriptase domain-containing protein n=1 Tax=Oreochromis niloticus TaxID=8128 RepID=A0A669C582_ORENI
MLLTYSYLLKMVLISQPVFFNNYCLSILDEICPFKTRSVSASKSPPWLNDSIRCLKRDCRKAERRWRKTHLNVHLLYLKDLLASFNNAIRDARAAHFSHLVTKSKGNPKVLFNTISDIVTPALPAAPIFSNEDCENFLSFLLAKIHNVRMSFTYSAPVISISTPSRPIVLDTFSPVSLPELVKLVNSVKASSCSLDIIPASLFKNVFQSIGPCVLTLINSSLASGIVPVYFKNAAILPLLKKPQLDPSLWSSYRPISKLPLIAKLLEKVVAKQLMAALDKHGIYDKFQSGFRQFHSTETALLRVSSDILMDNDAGKCSVLLMLDLTSAFDTVDHHILIERLKKWVGVSGTALEWFSSYLHHRSFSVAVSDFRSSSTSLTYGVPQGSVLGPLLFLIYLLPLQHIMGSFEDISYHCYADDIQLYISFMPEDLSKLQRLNDCLDLIKRWMAANFLQLNEGKTEVLVCTPDRFLSQIVKALGPLSLYVKSSIRNLGVTFDSSLTLDGHVNSLVRSCFYHLRNVARLSPILSRSELEIAIHAFISSRLDYCNSLFMCLSKGSLDRLQVVQNAAARLLTKSSKYSHVTPLLSQLHWLPVKFRVDFKILVLTYRAVHGLAPAYIFDLLQPYVPSRSLRSSDLGLLAIKNTKRRTKGDRAFATVAPRLWNSLPQALRTVDSVAVFKKQLKTHLFKTAFG